MKIIFTGGGTAGHINPAIAIAKYIKHKQPDAQILFVGTAKGMESTLVPKAGFEIATVEVSGFSRTALLSNVKIAFKAAAAYQKSKRVIKKFKPDIVIGTGGYVSGPVVLAAAHKKIPTLIHEQNVFAGVTTKMLCGSADVTAVAFEQSKKYLTKAKKIVHTGNPIRQELLDITKDEARAKLRVGEAPLVVIFGGSLGAQKLNEAVVDLLTKGIPSCKVILSTGERYYESCRSAVDGCRNENVTVVSYIHNMDEVLAAADLVICRAGAITLSELTALGKPSILIPSPNVAENHQEYNARALEKAGAAVVITEEELHRLQGEIIKLLGDRRKLAEMAEKSAEMGIKNGVESIYNEVMLWYNRGTVVSDRRL